MLPNIPRKRGFPYSYYNTWKETTQGSVPLPPRMLAPLLLKWFVCCWLLYLYPAVHISLGEVKSVSKVLGKLSDSRISYFASVTISASENNFLSWFSYKKFIHVWWSWIRIMARNYHQRALHQLSKLFAEALIVLFCIFYLWYWIACPLDDSHWGNIWNARIRHQSQDFWDRLEHWIPPPGCLRPGARVSRSLFEGNMHFRAVCNKKINHSK